MENGARVQFNQFSPVTCASFIIQLADMAARQIDDAISCALSSSRPVYLEIYNDLWTQEILAPQGKLHKIQQLTEKHQLDLAVEYTIKKLKESKSPLIWAGYEIKRYGYQQAFEQFLEVTNLNYVTDIQGKGILSEDNPHFKGVLDGKLAVPAIQKMVAESDLVLQMGLMVTDLDILGTTLGALAPHWVIYSSYSVVGQENFFAYQVPLGALLKALVSIAEKSNIKFSRKIAKPEKSYIPAWRGAEKSNFIAIPLTYDIFVATLDKSGLVGLHTNTTLVSDATLATFPIANDIVVKQDGFYAEFGWGSIGFTSGGAIGIKMATPTERIIVVIGDGGLQNCPTGLSTIAKLKQNTIVFVFVNGIYAIDQFLVDASVFKDPSIPIPGDNVLPVWDYVKLAEAFNGKGWLVENIRELEQAIVEAKANTTLSLIAVKIPERNLPACCDWKLSPDNSKKVRFW